MGYLVGLGGCLGFVGCSFWVWLGLCWGFISGSSSIYHIINLGHAVNYILEKTNTQDINHIRN